MDVIDPVDERLPGFSCLLLISVIIGGIILLDKLEFVEEVSYEKNTVWISPCVVWNILFIF